MRFKNISPLGDLDVPGVGVVPAGETFEVTGPQAASFEQQEGNFRRTDRPRRRNTPADAGDQTPAGDGDTPEETP